MSATEIKPTNHFILLVCYALIIIHATMNDLALVFPGQGSQRIGMLASLAAQHPSILTSFAEASEALGYDLWALAQEGPLELLNRTEHTQPILLTASVAIWRIWRRQGGVDPALMAGHSLGEWSALVCSGVIDFADAIKLVQWRGQLMQQAVPEGQGAMAAIIGLDDMRIRSACNAAQREASSAGDTCAYYERVVAPVNFNAPNQVVIAGGVAAVDRAIANCKALGAKHVMSLPVSAPFHTKLMRPAAEKLAARMKSVIFRRARVPIVHNVDAQTETDGDKIKQRMITQMYHPVLWVSCVNTLINHGVKNVIECGPGKILTGLIKRIDRSLTTAVTESPKALDNALTLSVNCEETKAFVRM